MLEWLLLSAAVLATIPVRVIARIDINPLPTFECVVYLYGVRMQFNGFLRRDGVISMHRDGGKKELYASIKRAYKFFIHIFNISRFSRVQADCRIGTGDAYTTALVASTLSAILKAVSAGVRAKVDVKPEFSRPFFAISLRCILSFRGGDIMVAGIQAITGQPPSKKKAGEENGTTSH